MSIDHVMNDLFNNRPPSAVRSNWIYSHEGHWEITVYTVTGGNGDMYYVSVRLHDAKIIVADDNHSTEFDTVDEMLSAIREAE